MSLTQHIGIDEWCYHNSLLLGKITIEKLMERARELGASGVGIDYFMLPKRLKDNFERTKELLTKNSLELVFGFGIPFAMPDFAFTLMKSHKTKMFELAHQFNSRIIRVMGGIIIPTQITKPIHLVLSKNKEIKHVAKRLKNFVEDAEMEGFIVAIENHTDYNAKETIEILERVNSDSLKVLFDTGNAVYFNDDPIESARLLAPHSVYTHIKDMKKYGPLWMSCPLGEGDIDVKEIIKILKENNYTGLYSIEIDLGIWASTKEDEGVEKSINYLKTIEAGRNTMEIQ